MENSEKGKKELSEIAQRCRKLRKRLGLTQQEMAKKFRVSKNTWQNWESDTVLIPDPMQLLIEQLEKQLAAIEPWADKCRRIRLELDLTRQEIAERLNIQPETWSDWESGKRIPQRQTREKVEEFFRTKKVA